MRRIKVFFCFFPLKLFDWKVYIKRELERETGIRKDYFGENVSSKCIGRKLPLLKFKVIQLSY